MLKNVTFLAGMLLCASAFASYPEATASRDFCDLELRKGDYGNGAGQNVPVFSRGKVTAGTVFKGVEGEYMCWRRERNPGACDSGLTDNFNCVKGTKGIQDNQPEKATIY